MQAKIPLGHSGWRTGLLFAWAIWWGGLSFYALFVVPIGTEIVGGFEQGLITAHHAASYELAKRDWRNRHSRVRRRRMD